MKANPFDLLGYKFFGRENERMNKVKIEREGTEIKRLTAEHVDIVLSSGLSDGIFVNLEISDAKSGKVLENVYMEIVHSKYDGSSIRIQKVKKIRDYMKNEKLLKTFQVKYKGSVKSRIINDIPSFARNPSNKIYGS